MREYKMPTDISEKEKVVGGLLTAGQLIFLGIGIGIMVAIGLSLFSVIGKASFVIGAIIGLPLGIVFSFYKPHKMPLFQYIRLKIARRKKTARLPSHNPDIDDIELDYFEVKRLWFLIKEKNLWI